MCEKHLDEIEITSVLNDNKAGRPNWFEALGIIGSILALYLVAFAKLN